MLRNQDKLLHPLNCGRANAMYSLQIVNFLKRPVLLPVFHDPLCQLGTYPRKLTQFAYRCCIQIE